MDIKKIYDFILKYKILSHVFHLSPVVLLGYVCIMYPFWWIDGTLDSLYAKIATAIACYGGFVVHLVWYFKNRKRF